MKAKCWTRRRVGARQEMASKGCEKSLHRLVNAMRLAVSMASKYIKYGIDTNELIQEAGIGLMKAAENFDPERECASLRTLLGG